MARGIRIGFNQGPRGVFLSTGKFGILRPSMDFSTTGVVGTPRRFFPDWYVAVTPNELNGAGEIPNGGHVTGVYPNNVATGGVHNSAGPFNAGATCMVMRLNWNDIDKGTHYDYTLPDIWMAQCRAMGVGLIIQIITRSFGGFPSTAPAYLDAYGEVYTGTIQTGWQVWRWSPFVLLNFQALCIALGNRYNAEPFFAGLATQETATGGANGKLPQQGDYSVTLLQGIGSYTGNDTYSGANYQTSLTMENQIIATACPNARCLFYVNDIANSGAVSSKNRLIAIALAVKQYGTLWCGPDLVSDLEPGNLNGVAYPSYASMHASGGLTGCSIQSAEWLGTKAPAPHPPVAGSLGPPGVYKNPSIHDLVNYGTSSSHFPTSFLTGARDHSPTAPSAQRSPLNLDFFVVNHQTGANANGDNYQNTAAPIMAAYRGFGTIVPNP